MGLSLMEYYGQLLTSFHPKEGKTMNHKRVKKLEILFLEDSPRDADLIYEYLCENFKCEIQVDIVLNEGEFVSAISLKKYELILADFMLPDFNGFAALDHIKSMSPSTPFICVSGFIDEETAVELLKQGATDYVSKDKLGRLKHSIERALKESKENEEKEKRAAELVIANKELVIQNEEKEKRAAELILANAYLENLINYANASIIVLDPQLHITLFNPVSYTHLRAHETRHDLVCRLLLEKK